MKQTILMTAILIGFLAFSSCERDALSPNKGSILSEAALFEPTVYVETDAYVREVTANLEQEDAHSSYKSGVIEYRENGTLTARIEFGELDEDGHDIGTALCHDSRGSRDVDLGKMADKDSDYEKIVVEPLVKAENCDYIVAGSISFFKNGEWLATIDFGDGTCDDLATKVTADGDIITFSLEDAKWGDK